MQLILLNSEKTQQINVSILLNLGTIKNGLFNLNLNKIILKIDKNTIILNIAMMNDNARGQCPNGLLIIKK